MRDEIKFIKIGVTRADDVEYQALLSEYLSNCWELEEARRWRFTDDILMPIGAVVATLGFCTVGMAPKVKAFGVEVLVIGLLIIGTLVVHRMKR